MLYYNVKNIGGVIVENKYLLPEMQIAMQTVPMQTVPMQTSVNQEMVERGRDNLPIQLVYPEIFYKLQH